MEKKLLEKLIEILNKEYSLYQKEYEIVEKRIELIKNRDVTDLNNLISEERNLSEDIAFLEGERISIVKSYGEKLTLKELAFEIKDTKSREILLELREKLIGILDDIRVKNELSSQLIDVSSKMLDTIMKEAAGEKELGYDKYSKKSSVVNNNLLNTRG